MTARALGVALGETLTRVIRDEHMLVDEATALLDGECAAIRDTVEESLDHFDRGDDAREEPFR